MPYHIHPLENCLARILVKDTDLQPMPSGAGVALPGGRVLTCAHVVNAALRLPNSSKEKPEEIITVDFPLSGSKEKITAKVGFWDYETDLAELIIIESLPSEVTPVYLHTQDELWDHRVQVFGFPSKNLDGAWADCQLRGHNTLGWVEIFDTNITGNFIQQGFSGGPVWDSTSKCVIGIIVAVDKNTDARIGYLIPANKIAEKWTEMPIQQTVKTKQTPNKINSSERSLKVFLCHSSSDKPAVRELYNNLIASGIDAWLDEQKLLAGQKWDIEIQKAVRDADAVIVCLSKTSITKEGYFQKELKFSLDIALEKLEGTIYIIPVRLEDCKIPDRLSLYHCVNFFGDQDSKEQAFDNVLASLRRRAQALDMEYFYNKEIINSDISKSNVTENQSKHGAISEVFSNKQSTLSTSKNLWSGFLESSTVGFRSSENVSASIGEPFQWADGEMLGSSWKPSINGDHFYLLQLAFTISPRGKIRVTSVDFSLTLSPQGDKRPIVFDVFPHEQTVLESNTVTIGIGPDFKFGTTAEAKLDIISEPTPIVRVEGLQQPRVTWYFTEHPKYPLTGLHRTMAMVSLPPGIKTTLATLELTVTAESRFGPIRVSTPESIQQKLRWVVGEK